MMHDFIDEYIKQISKMLTELAVQKDFIENLASEIVVRAIKGKCVFVFGNGGSAATASHFVSDLCKGANCEGKPKVKAICFSDNIPTFTAWANDTSFEDVFARQMDTFAENGDLAIAISCSGNSINVLKAVEVARRKGVYCIGLCGFDGGALAKLADTAIINSSKYIQQTEDIHVLMLHLTSMLVKQKLETEC
jgi:D-sedoheptulose 7-phosphate isomerase